MENISVSKSPDISNYKPHVTNVSRETILRRKRSFNPSMVTLISQGGIDFVRFLTSLNLSDESDILILPSNQHYYYEEKELKSVRTIVNLKKLNMIKHLDTFLYSLVRILPPNANFIGCFSDSNALNVNGFSIYHPLKLFNRIINFLDSRTDHFMNKDEVSGLLGKNGFKALNMKEMNGLTYFHCKISNNLLS